MRNTMEYVFDSQGTARRHAGIAVAALAVAAFAVVPAFAQRSCEPQHLATLAVQSPHAVAVGGDTVCVASATDGLLVIDVSDPANPTLVATVKKAGFEPRGVDVQGNYAYVADRRAGYQDSGVRVVDISEPADAAIVGSVDLEPSYSVTVAGDLAYVAGREVEILDVSDPNEPALVGSFDVGGWYATEVAIDGDFAYVSSLSIMEPSPGAFHVVDLSAPGEPTAIGTVETESDAFDVAFDDGIAYVTDGTLYLVDVTDPGDPFVVRSLDGGLAERAVAINGDVAYVTGSGLLRALDVSDPSDPVVMGEVDLSGAPRDIALADGTAYVVDAWWAEEDGALSVVDVSSCQPCPGDLNGDGRIDLEDLSTLLTNFGDSGGADREDGDLDGDGDVDLHDLSRMLARFGATCG